MYSIENFEPYTLRKSMGQEVVLAWSQKNGYHFLSFIERHTGPQDYKIIATEKSK